MSRTRLAAVALILLMTLPAVLVVSPAALAEEVVPVAPSVRYELETGFTHNLYLRFANANNLRTTVPDCSATSLQYAPYRASESSPRAPCAVTMGTGGTTAAGDLGNSRTFESAPLKRPFTVAGLETIFYHHKGDLPAGMTLTAELFSGGNPVGTGSYLVTDDNEGSGPHAIPIVFQNQATNVTFQQDQAIRLVVRGTLPPPDAGEVATPGTFMIDDTGSRLEIQSRDAIRAAAWVGEPRVYPKTLFRPLSASTPLEQAPRLQFFFSVQSAFGWDDLVNDDTPAPRFSLTRGNQTVFLTPQSDPYLEGQYNSTVSDPPAGIATWTLRTGQPVDFRNFTAGEYTLRVQARHQQGAGYVSGTSARFVISSQSVRLAAFEEPDVSVTMPDETLGHDLAAGSDTTYLLNITNAGSVNDTFRVDASLVTASPPTGWSASVGGPSTLQRVVSLGPGESKLVTVTVRAPSGAPVGASSIFRVNATSTLDPAAVSPTVTLTSTVSNVVRREVAILATARSFEVDPGVAREVPVYVWNRGTRPADISLEMQQSTTNEWTAELVQGGLPTQRLVLSNVAPGAIAEATMRVTGPIGQGRTHSVVLNATQLDASGVSFDRPVRFVTKGVGGVSVQVLDGTRVAELKGTGPAGGDDPRCANPATRGAGVNCDADNVTGIWFRVWVTNSGKVAEGYNLSLQSISYARADGCTSAFDDGAAGTPAFGFYTRTRAGLPVPITGLGTLEPGQTAEVYVWRSVAGGSDPCEDDRRGVDYVSFVVTARGLTTGLIGSAPAEAFARNAERTQEVVIESVGRVGAISALPGANETGPFLVDVNNATRRAVTGGVFVNETATYRIRVTNGASWGRYLDDRGNLQEPRVNVYTLGEEARRAGWNISLRPLQGAQTPLAGTANYSFTNEFGGRVDGWSDVELEVRVTAPSAANGTALAGATAYFFVVAHMPGREASSTLEIRTVVLETANLTLAADTRNLQAHAGEAAASLLLIENVGSAAANATLRASIDPSTPNPGAWRVEPAFQSFRLSAAKNRTVALLVTPPAGAGAGTTGTVNVVLDYSPAQRGNVTLQVPVTVMAAGTLDVTTPVSDATIAPGGFANFTLNVRNRGNLPVSYLLSASPLPEWDTTIAAPEGILAAGETRSVPYVLRAPASVENNARFASVVRVVEDGNDANFDAQPLGISILGGKAVPGVNAPLLQKRVDRGSLQAFPIEIRNTGNAAGRLFLEARSSDPAWQVSLQDERGENVTSVRLGPNELTTLNATVRAPLVVPERTVVPIEVTASSEDFTQASKVTVRAEVHDYGLAMSLSPARIETAPGLPTEFIVRVRNTGNDNDTLNVSAHLPDLTGWTVSLSTERVTLEPGQEGEVRATVRSPTETLPPSRTYGFRLFAGTVGGAAVGLPKNESLAASVVILPYRSYDVDDDEQIELAVDADGNAANGYESFREPFGDGLQTNVVSASLLDGRARFFLDVPREGHDGIADVWFDPDDVYAYEIELRPDVNNDGTPDYFLDTDRDQKIDRGYDTVMELYWSVTEIDALGDGTKQYVVDTTTDGRPDYYYDAVAKLSTRTQSVTGRGATTVGLDTDNDGQVDKYYDYRTNSVQDVTLAKASGLLTKYWYFIALFVLMLVATVALLVARRRRA